MSFRIHLKLLFVCISIILLINQRPCYGMIEKHRAEHDRIMQQARKQINLNPVAADDIHIRVDPNGPADFIGPEASWAERSRILGENINRMLLEARAEPNEITAFKVKLGQLSEQEDSGFDPSLYKDLSEKLDIAYAYADVIEKKNQLYESNLDELQTIYDETAYTGESAEFRFTASFIANIVVVLGMITRIGNITTGKLDRQLKILQIAEKKAQLEKDGVKLE